ncbi:MAG: sulfite exporter TauE/SafE family protein [Alphaproteobacteria bacterium]|nr:sulfite exporter TauE/SafE family protein [Alphaproteobacteria bacterium]
MSVDLLVFALGLATSVVIGLTSIGGMLIVPGLVFVLGFDVANAIPATMLAFLPAAVIGLVMILQMGSLDRPANTALWIGAIPGALLGALALPYVAVGALYWLMVVIMAVSGLRALGLGPRGSGAAALPGRGELAATGFGVGIVSALTGTGGPVTLVPIMMLRGVTPAIIVPLAQAITIPITGLASLGYWTRGSVEPRLTLVLAAGCTVGIVLGIRAKRHVPAAQVTRLIAIVLVASAALLAARLLLG